MKNKLFAIDHLMIFQESILWSVRLNPELDAQQTDEAVNQIRNVINEMLEKVMSICKQ